MDDGMTDYRFIPPFLLVLYFIATIAMQYNTTSSWSEALMGFPVIAIGIFCSFLIKKLTKKEQPTKRDIFRKDLHTIIISFIIGSLLLIILNYDNSDMKAWWGLWLYFMLFFGLIFSFIYSLIKTTLKITSHAYTIIYSYLIIGMYILLQFLPMRINFLSLGDIEPFYLLTVILIFTHLGSCLLLKRFHSQKIK
jgi:predicted neutral ceramidase superfamily lipid hydrolase